ncbi:MAG: crossover junction endodeoxyribonuclease RuvC [Candidatus Taylorbacteria bacterium]|nr:crossover junction endodeoxyribonuclease RuvC [Candidatus Taylorbacteria bacterium]
MRIISIDPGYERLGVAIIEKTRTQKETVIYSDCIRTSSDLVFEDRLHQIGNSIERILEEHTPEALAIENLFISNNQKTAMRVAEVRGVLIYLAKKFNLSVKEYTPLQIKLAVTGDGKSGKDQVIRMVKMLVKNIKDKALDDEYDAIAIGLAFFAYEKQIL